jgi:hypothetical protein
MSYRRNQVLGQFLYAISEKSNVVFYKARTD